MNRPGGSPARFPLDLCFAVAVWIAAVGLSSRSVAADAVVETVLDGLQDPYSISIRPAAESSDPYEILVFDRGAGSIVSVRSDEPGRSTKLIGGWKAGDRAEVVLALDARHVIASSGKALLSVYALATQGESLAADDASQTIEAPKALEPAPPRHVSAIIRTRANRHVPDMLILAMGGEGAPGGLWQVPIRADTLGDVAPFSPASNDAARPVSALAVSNEGFIVAAEAARPDRPTPSRLTFYNPIDGSVVLRLPVDLHEISAIACSPKSGNLYVAAMELDSETPGVYRVDDATRDGRRASKAVKIADVQRPAAIAFGPDGSLYVATIDDADSAREQGTLKRIKGSL